MSPKYNFNELKVIWEIYESDLYHDDTDFDEEGLSDEQIDDKKMDYYYGEFWYGTDYLTFPNKKRSTSIEDSIRVFCINKEILIDDPYDICDGIKPLIELIMKQFYCGDWDKYFEPIWCSNNIDSTKEHNWDDSRYTIQYRGGRGYYYYVHQWIQWKGLPKIKRLVIVKK